MTAEFQVYKDARGETRWRLRADNGASVAASSESYVAKADALAGIDNLRRMNGTTEVYQDEKSEWRWRLTHANGRILATSGEGYVKRSDCDYGLALTTKLAKDAPIREM